MDADELAKDELDAFQAQNVLGSWGCCPLLVGRACSISVFGSFRMLPA